jgi:CheY-like chemotaxis protein
MSVAVKKKVLAIVSDMMFTVKIDAAAKQTYLEILYPKTLEEALRLGKEKPVLVIVDLNHNSLDAIALIDAFKSDKTLESIKILSFYSHVQTELRQQALDVGCDDIVPRSAFSVNLPQILKRHSSTM